jgi:hypothetical protein
LIGGAGARRSKEAWTQVYRALEHSHARRQCRDAAALMRFHPSVQRFADAFVSMQSKRHDADYDPDARFYKSAVQYDIANARDVITGFGRAPQRDRRAFAAWVLLKPRRP